MAERRMFSRTVIESDNFLDMPITARLLYYDLGMRADDDGFINNPRRIMREIGVSNDDLSILIMKNFIMPFDSGIIVVKHWKMNNYIQKDRYKETAYLAEKASLTVEKNKIYEFAETPCIQNVSKLDTQVRLGKVSIGKVSVGYNARAHAREEEHTHADEESDFVDVEESEQTEEQSKQKAYGEFRNVILTEDEHKRLSDKVGIDCCTELIERLSRYMASKGVTYGNHYATLIDWYEREKKQTAAAQPQAGGSEFDELERRILYGKRKDEGTKWERLD